MNYLKLFFKGFVIGMTSAIPSVSGGTIIVVTGIFDGLIDSANNFYRDFQKNFEFLLPLFAGTVAGIIILSRPVSYCLANYAFPSGLFFTGLIAGSLPYIYRRASERGDVNLIWLVLGVFSVVGLVFLKVNAVNEPLLSFTARDAAMLFFVGMIVAAALVTPGMSGQLVLVLSGYYSKFLYAVSEYNISLLLAFSLGVVIGIPLISKIIDILLKKAYTVTYSAILGLVAASPVPLLLDNSIYLPGITTLQIALGTVLACIGFIIAFKLGK